ncbi:hypothetical protein CYMTET_33652 [Cymbomonas tetramitiformis]|uniref:Potassium channel domain-containing protein n=1 Tax=Cymbomonas tetramitiformis TaxID=36881 RepID=A0AAE0KQZ2_9CHLO|nr:hypothetical protein CYMTET_33652 [Cymbomonas tetramitiformis]
MAEPQVEYRNDNTEVNNFFDALYFSTITLTTVGFGDITPKTTIARLVTSCSVLLGVLLIPAQLTSLAASLMQVVDEPTEYNLQPCKKCNLSRHDIDARFCKVCGSMLDA